MNIPAYYVFTNEELDKLIEVKPKTIEELTNSNILPAIKIKTHGEKIISIINGWIALLILEKAVHHALFGTKNKLTYIYLISKS